MRGLSPVAASGGHSSSRCVGLSLSWPLLLWSTGSRRAGSAIAAHGPSCSAAYGILPDQDSNPCPLHWQADSQSLRHQGSPVHSSFYLLIPNSQSFPPPPPHPWQPQVCSQKLHSELLYYSRSTEEGGKPSPGGGREEERCFWKSL